ncbi:MAG: glycosyltransferase family protein [Candidatus Staskawiczbacteria bacterium]|jgi:spore coat polysaccharide biosynthesis protein SpsF (cytidylyltransferase family)
MSLGIIIQARMESKRLPGKVYKKILGKHLLEWVILRTQKSKLIQKIVVAIPDTEKSSVLLPVIKKSKVAFYQGSSDDVLDRYIKTAEKFQIDPVVRITADCPLIDWRIIDDAIGIFKKGNYEYLVNDVSFGGYSPGFDLDILFLETLKKIAKLTDEKRHKEHVITFPLEHPELFKIKYYKAPKNLYRQNYRLCVDEKPDLTLMRKVFGHFEPSEDFSAQEIIEYLDENPQVADINTEIKHNYAVPLKRKKS